MAKTVKKAGVSGNSVAGKSFQMFTVSEALLAKVTEAVRAGEKEARSSGSIQSFEVFCRGLRMNISLGRVMVVPPAVCGDRKDFPTALLYGRLVRVFGTGGEEVADLIEKRIGDNEFDEYSQADFDTIRKELFEDKRTGKEACLVIFAPNWMNCREYVGFHFSDDESQLKNDLRHLVFSAYYNPAVSSAFDALMTNVNTTKVDVTDITPKLTYPFLSENPLKQFPQLEKQAGWKRATVLLNSKTADEVEKQSLDPQELDVFEALDEALKTSLLPPVEDAEEAGGREDYKAPTEKDGVPRAASKEAATAKVAYVAHVPGHKNSKGESAPWVIKQHETGKILSSHKTKAEAKSHLQDMHAHSGASKSAEEHEVDLKSKGKFDVEEGSLHKALGIPEDQTIPMEKLHQVMNDESRSEHVRNMARSAIGLKSMDHSGSLKTADRPVAPFEAPFTNVGPGTDAAEEQENSAEAMKESVGEAVAKEDELTGSPIGIAIDETGVPRREEEERKVGKKAASSANPSNRRREESHPETLRVDPTRLSSAVSAVYNGGHVERTATDRVLGQYAEKTGFGDNDRQAPHAARDHAKQAEAGAYGEDPMSRRSNEKWGSAEVRVFKRSNKEVMADYIADVVAAEIDEPSEALSAKGRQARAKNEAKLASMRPKAAEAEINLDSVWDEITEDIGPAPLVEVAENPANPAPSNTDSDGEGGRPNKRDVGDMPEAMRSPEPEDKKEVTEGDAEREEAGLENEASKAEKESAWNIDSKYADFVEDVAEEIEDAEEPARLGCDQCQMMSIQGVPCHETGCPNSGARWDEDRGDWVRQRECRECGSTVDADDPCCSATMDEWEEQPETEVAEIERECVASKKAAFASEGLLKKLNPRRFPGMSGKMAAIVGYILGEQFTDPSITDMAITSDGIVMAQQSGDVGMNDMVGSYSDLKRNWDKLLGVAGLEAKEMKEARALFAKITSYQHTGSAKKADTADNEYDIDAAPNPTGRETGPSETVECHEDADAERSQGTDRPKPGQGADIKTAKGEQDSRKEAASKFADAAAQAEKLMVLDNDVWDELGIQSGSMLMESDELATRYATRMAQVLKANGVRRVGRKALDILENENYHSLYKLIEDIAAGKDVSKGWSRNASKTAKMGKCSECGERRSLNRDRVCHECEQDRREAEAENAAEAKVSSKTADTADNPSNERGGEDPIRDKNTVVVNTRGEELPGPSTPANHSKHSGKKTADTADNPANEQGGEGAIAVKTNKVVTNTRGGELPTATSPANHSKHSGKEAAKRCKGCGAPISEDWGDRCDKCKKGKKADTADNPFNWVDGKGAPEDKKNYDVRDTSGPDAQPPGQKRGNQNKGVRQMVGEKHDHGVEGDLAQARSEATSPDAVDKDIPQPTVSVYDAGKRKNSAEAEDAPNDPPGYGRRVRELEEEGLTTSDAQAVADAEFAKKSKGAEKTALHFMNEYDVMDAVRMYAENPHAAARFPLRAKAATFLREFMDEVNSHSDGWAYWRAPVAAANQLMTLIEASRHEPEIVTEQSLRKALAPIRAFMTRKGNAVGMKLPVLAADVSGDMSEARAGLTYDKAQVADEPEADDTKSAEEAGGRKTASPRYREMIVKALGCTPREADEVEDIMRHDIFHSTLDWQTREQFDEGARQAWELLRQMPKQADGVERDFAEAEAGTDMDKAEVADDAAAECTVNPEHFACGEDQPEEVVIGFGAGDLADIVMTEEADEPAGS